MDDIIYNAKTLTGFAEKFLHEKFPNALIMREFNAAKWGNALIDVVAITEKKIIGIEIKGQGDSLTRLKLQGPAYSMVASHMFLLCCPELFEKCQKKDLIPYRWEYLKVSGESIDWGRSYYNCDFKTVDDRPSFHPNSARALCSMLWKKELVRFGQELRCDVKNSMAVDTIIDEVSEKVPLREIRTMVIKYLRSRDWSFKNHVIDPKIDPNKRSLKSPQRPQSLSDLLADLKVENNI